MVKVCSFLFLFLLVLVVVAQAGKAGVVIHKLNAYI